ncbi:MAG: hypothetical protein AAF607_07735 [Pseudomonadota bacterium]
MPRPSLLMPVLCVVSFSLVGGALAGETVLGQQRVDARSTQSVRSPEADAKKAAGKRKQEAADQQSFVWRSATPSARSSRMAPAISSPADAMDDSGETFCEPF